MVAVSIFVLKRHIPPNEGYSYLRTPHFAQLVQVSSPPLIIPFHIPKHFDLLIVSYLTFFINVSGSLGPDQYWQVPQHFHVELLVV